MTEEEIQEANRQTAIYIQLRNLEKLLGGTVKNLVCTDYTGKVWHKISIEYEN